MIITIRAIWFLIPLVDPWPRADFLDLWDPIEILISLLKKAQAINQRLGLFFTLNAPIPRIVLRVIWLI